jgi:hypothetical protein
MKNKMTIIKLLGEKNIRYSVTIFLFKSLICRHCINFYVY